MTNNDPLDSLLTRVAVGDRSAVPDLLNRCVPDMVARLQRRPYANEAEDIVQEALAQACQASQNPDRFTWRGWEALQAWLWSFVENAHADRCKYHVRDCRDVRRVVKDRAAPGADSSRVGVLAGVAGREETPSRQARRRERDERLRQAMREVLTEEQRLAIELRHFEYLSVEEVAERAGWTESKVKMLCQRGYERLREVLTESMRPTAS